jgi:hypothetical protein
MSSRYLDARKWLSGAVLTATVLFSSAVWADGPGYTYFGSSYEWTDVKYGVDPNADPNFNNGSLEGVNFDLSLGLLSWLHLTGQYFTGDCSGCTTTIQNNQPVNVDMGFDGYKAGLGFNFNLNKKRTTDFVVRGNYIDVNLDRGNAPPAIPARAGSSVGGTGASIELLIRSQISEKADVMVGYEYQAIDYTREVMPMGGTRQFQEDTIKNTDIIVGIGYRVWKGLSLNGNAIIFDNDTGFDLGIRWYFGGLWGRDTIIGSDEK